jgi:hypothetical protein
MKSKYWISSALAALLAITLLPLDAATATQALPAVGDTGPGGGKIIYVSDTPFPCGPTGSGLCNVLEWGNADDLGAARTRLFLQQISVSHQSDAVGANARNGAIGEGYKNTMAWVEQNGVYNSTTNNYAAGKVRALTIGGKSDWYLANAAELAVLYSYVSTYLPGFLNLWYMDSSSEVDSERYIGWWFGSGNADGAGPNAKASGANNGLAAIRAFTWDAAAAKTPAQTEAQAKSAAEAAAEAAAAKREAEKQAARADITNKLKSAKDLSVDSFAKAEIPGITATNIAAVQAELLALPEATRADINQVLKVAHKYEVVGNIGSGQINYMQSNSFIEIGLIPADSKNKVALVAAVRLLPEGSRDTYAEIKTAIDAEIARIQARKDRLVAAITRNSNRYMK